MSECKFDLERVLEKIDSKDGLTLRHTPYLYYSKTSSRCPKNSIKEVHNQRHNNGQNLPGMALTGWWQGPRPVEFRRQISVGSSTGRHNGPQPVEGLVSRSLSVLTDLNQSNGFLRVYDMHVIFRQAQTTICLKQ